MAPSGSTQADRYKGSGPRYDYALARRPSLKKTDLDLAQMPQISEHEPWLPNNSSVSHLVEIASPDEADFNADEIFEARTIQSMIKGHSQSTQSANRRRNQKSARFLKEKLRQLITFIRLRPLSSFLFLCSLTVFCTWLGFTIKYILDPDKERMPWREVCAEQRPFVNQEVEHLAPVDVLVGIMSYDQAFERRQTIRQTYATMTQPRDDSTGLPLGNVQVKFILGRPRKAFVDRVAMEMEMYNDLVILDAKETGSSYKTLRFFQWAAKNGTVPILMPRNAGGLIGAPALDGQYDVHWKLADYVIKADDDSFIMLDELERRLRSLSRQMVYWGYLVRGQFMAGEAYALSQDLVQYLAQSKEVSSSWHGKEDTKMAQWIRMHPNASTIHWAAENCWIYDHPRSWTPYAHGFLFPDHVDEVRREMQHGLPDEEVKRRGGQYFAKSFSTTSQWKQKYMPPQPDLSSEETIEALVEGGGRWKNVWYRQSHDKDTPLSYPRESIVLSSNDPRLGLGASNSPRPKHAYNIMPQTGLAVYTQGNMNLAPSKTFHSETTSPPYGATYASVNEAIMSKRFLGGKVGGTVVVHYCKKEAWFFETALALLGRQRTWSYGSGGAGRNWRMDGSPLIQPYSYSTMNIVPGRKFSNA
ncbi:hypothetical protein MYAM1_001625 [Malassezia yamatoensis]|uniref:Glycosyltransferase family 31 protein n=1 Tax=Malassezia yamatoensis TaxID=253288 RepID=A0AAJ6CG18_9BASI|nr:hypothetical protein MYAM1_001625 [Malassezia yamatoensis]